MLPNCPGVIEVGSANELLCVDEITLQPVAWQGHVAAADFTPDMIDALAASEAFAAGFFIYASFWVLIAGVQLAIRAFSRW